jgi:hypothetical protein
MKRFIPYLAFVAGVLALVILIPHYDAVQPGVSITRGDAQRIAGPEAVKLGIPVDKAWTTTIWVNAPHIERELEKDPERRRRAALDPAIGPRLGGYRVTYHRRDLEKFIPYGYIYVGMNGEVLAARLRQRPETPGANATEAHLRPKADAFIKSHKLPGAPSPVFESARPQVLRSRTDWTFRYRVPTDFPIGNVVTYVWVHYNGDRFAGWDLIEEYADGAPFRFDSEISGAFLGFAALYITLLLLLLIFLKKYHAGEVGVRTGSFLFAVTMILLIAGSFIVSPAASENTGLGSISAQQTAWAIGGFQLLFVGMPLAVLVFFAWAVGESYARERWGHRLASFDAILRRDPINATVGNSIFVGLLTAPAVAAMAFLVGLIPLMTGTAHASAGNGSFNILNLGGPVAQILSSAVDAISATVVAILFVLAYGHRKRVLWAGLLAAVVLMTIGTVATPPIDPQLPRLLFGFGGGLAAIAIFLRYDLLSAATSLFFGSTLIGFLPLLSASSGEMRRQMLITLAVPAIAAVAVAVAGMITRREVVYSYEDLAPHVKRIVERERVKAEIDAANRIQAALLPLESPTVIGATVASHYRAATEIGGDYFDFLELPSGEVGIAFGDVSGHGLTSGIVMSMAKAALLVQVGYDASPRAVLDVLNDIVIRTAPKRIMMTFFFGLLDPIKQSIRFSSAGHLDPYVYRANSGKIEMLSSWGFPLGVRRRDAFREHSVEFSAGDRLILYSDGLIEAVDDDGDPFGFDRFEHTIRGNGHLSADEIKKSLLTAVRKFTRNRPPEDDQTLVVVAFEEISSDSMRSERHLAIATAADVVH